MDTTPDCIAYAAYQVIKRLTAACNVTDPERTQALLPDDSKCYPIDVMLQQLKRYSLQSRRFRVVIALLSEIAYHDNKLNAGLYQPIADQLALPSSESDCSRRLTCPYA